MTIDEMMTELNAIKERWLMSPNYRTDIPSPLFLEDIGYLVGALETALVLLKGLQRHDRN